MRRETFGTLLQMALRVLAITEVVEVSAGKDGAASTGGPSSPSGGDCSVFYRVALLRSCCRPHDRFSVKGDECRAEATSPTL